MRKYLLKTALLILISGMLSCSGDKIKIACVGDSITEGYGLEDPSETAYPEVLNEILGENYSVLNCGKSSTTLIKSGNKSYWDSKEFSSVFCFKPNIITIKLGTNDTKAKNWNKETFLESYQSMIDTFRTIHGNPEIYVCLPVPVFKTKWGINDSTINAGVIPAINEIAAKNKLKIIDLNTPFINDSLLFPDGIHPNEEAEAKIAEIISKVIVK